jgi:hypothetical protein
MSVTIESPLTCTIQGRAMLNVGSCSIDCYQVAKVLKPVDLMLLQALSVAINTYIGGIIIEEMRNVAL